MQIDYEKLRRDLMDYYGTATGFFPMAFLEVAKVEQADENELIRLAKKNGFDLSKYGC